ncbi:MAG: type II secretion system GspH family protein [Heliobacteriaceae bacterium]|jgi:prepilin-type N-terminal cleavage/methylation domain-containing protein|nr:type II secretion system GspH family protein [Heliobacteriaceae bacterium]
MDKKKSAFTLAEVLITLGIIGVVAALTMPALIIKYEKKQAAVRLKKAYSELSQAVKFSELDNGSVDDWDYSLGAQIFFERYFKDYLKNVKQLKASQYKQLVDYKALNSVRVCAVGARFCENSSYGVMLANGTILYFTDSSSVIIVDVNGFKKPNMQGRDLFLLSVQPVYGVTPFGFGRVENQNEGFGNEYNRNKLMANNPYSTCNKTQYGNWCAALIMLDGWEIRDDYPW